MVKMELFNINSVISHEIPSDIHICVRLNLKLTSRQELEAVNKVEKGHDEQGFLHSAHKKWWYSWDGLWHWDYQIIYIYGIYIYGIYIFMVYIYMVYIYMIILFHYMHITYTDRTINI